MRKHAHRLVVLLTFGLVGCAHTQKQPAFTQSAAFRVTTDYRMTSQAMLQAGQYELMNERVLFVPRVPKQGLGMETVDLYLVAFGRWTIADEVLAELDRRNLRPARIEELLAFGAKYPKVQLRYTVIGLDAFWMNSEGMRFYPYLGHYQRWREIDLLPDDVLMPEYYFLAAPKSMKVLRRGVE